MIPVFRLSDLQKRPADPNARAKALEMCQKLKESEEAFRKICAEKGIPYTPAMCASPYGTTYFCSNAPRPKKSGFTIADVWPN